MRRQFPVLTQARSRSPAGEDDMRMDDWPFEIVSWVLFLDLNLGRGEGQGSG